MIFDFGKNIGGALGGVFETITGLGGVLSDATQAVKRFGQSTDEVAEALAKARLYGILFKKRYEGKKQSIFKSNPVLWGASLPMKNRELTTDGYGLWETQQRSAQTFTSSSPYGSVTASTISTTSTI